jgi:hypothetical protein
MKQSRRDPEKLAWGHAVVNVIASACPAEVDKEQRHRMFSEPVGTVNATYRDNPAHFLSSYKSGGR